MRVWDTRSAAGLMQRLDLIADDLGVPVERLSLDGSGAMDSFLFHRVGIPTLSLHGLAPGTFGIPHTARDDLTAIDERALVDAYRLVGALLERLVVDTPSGPKQQGVRGLSPAADSGFRSPPLR